jgi:hypothetical protein
MIPVPAGVRVWLAAGHTDMRMGFGGLATLLQHTAPSWITRLPAPNPGGFHSAVRAGGCATPTGFAARAGAQANHAPTFKLDHSLVADQRKADQPDLSSLAPSQIPRISRKPSVLTALATSRETLRTSPAQLRFITIPSR